MPGIASSICFDMVSFLYIEIGGCENLNIDELWTVYSTAKYSTLIFCSRWSDLLSMDCFASVANECLVLVPGISDETKTTSSRCNEK